MFLFVDVILIVVVNATPTCIQAMSKDMSSMMGSNGILPPLFFLALSILQLVSIVTENELPMMVCSIYKNYENIIQLKKREPVAKKSINIFLNLAGIFLFIVWIHVLSGIWIGDAGKRCYDTKWRYYYQKCRLLKYYRSFRFC